MKREGNNRVRVVAAAACAAAAVTIGTMILDNYSSRGEKDISQPAIETTMQVEKSKDTPGYVIYGENGTEEARLTENQYHLLEILYEKISKNDRAGAAAHINENEAQFRQMYKEALGGASCFFDGSNLKSEADGHGMVLRHPTTVFFGDFKDGMPEGKCLALKAVVLDYPRYDYSDGVWKSGRMNGPGKIGYFSYEGTDGTENPGIEKEGDFVGDLMDGMITYRTANCDGIYSSWEIETREGTTVITDLWAYDKDHDDYRLLSKNDDNRGFALKASEIDSVRWMNLIKWDE